MELIYIWQYKLDNENDSYLIIFKEYFNNIKYCKISIAWLLLILMPNELCICLNPFLNKMYKIYSKHFKIEKKIFNKEIEKTKKFINLIK